MDKKQMSPGLSQAGLLPTQEEQVLANSPSRKRPLDSDDDDDDDELQTKRARTTRPTRPTSEPARLTRQNLARFNKMGKKKSSNPSDDSRSTKTKTTSTTSAGFADKARQNGILDPHGSRLATNLEEIRQQQAKSRATASPPESVYNDYVDRVDRAGNESTIVIATSKRLLKEYPTSYPDAYNRAFTNLPKDAGFNNGLSAPQPDFVEGLEKEEYRPFPVDDYIPGAALYQDDPRSITLPHIAGEWKGPAGDMREARMQGAYGGAAMVYARNKALAYMGKEDPPGHASVTTFTTDGTNLNLYAHYAAPSEEDHGAVEYHQCLVSTTNLTGSYESFKKGRKHLRNAQDHAREHSYALKDHLKEHYKQQRGTNLHPIAAEAPSLPVPAIEPPDADEDDGDYEVVEHQLALQPTPPTSSKHRNSKTHSHHSHPTPHSSKAPSSTHSPAHNSGSKRKAPGSQSSHGSSAPVSKHRSYWKKERETGRYYHLHSDGTVSWLDDEEDEEDERD